MTTRRGELAPLRMTAGVYFAPLPLFAKYAFIASPHSLPAPSSPLAKMLHVLVRLRNEGGAFIDDCDSGLLRSLAGRVNIDERGHRIIQDVGVLNVSAGQVERRVDPHARVLPVRDGEDLALLVTRRNGIDKLRVPIVRPLALLVRAEQRHDLLERR